MKMTNEERQALIDYCNTRIAECATYAKARKVMEIALASLTADPVKVPDEPTGGDAPCHLDEYEGYCWVAGARWMRGKILSRLNAIDNTAQQYESLGKGDKC